MDMQSILRKTSKLGAVLALGLGAATSASQAGEVTLRAVSAFPLDTQFGKPFKAFVDKVNKDGKGIVHIQLLGGPESMPPAEDGNAVRNGVVDIAWTAPNYYGNLMPEAGATAFGDVSPAELRKNGGWDYLEALHAKKVNAYLLTTFGWGIQHHLYMAKPIKSLADLKGDKIRPAPGMQDFFSALGASNVSMMAGDVYTALQRHVIDGYSWPLWGINDLGWDTVTKQRIDPGYGGVQVNAIVNLDTWKKKLDKQQRDLLKKTVVWFESYSAKTIAATNESEKKKQQASGIKVLQLSAQQADELHKTFSKAMWNSLKEDTPGDVAKLKSYLVQ